MGVGSVGLIGAATRGAGMGYKAGRLGKIDTNIQLR